MSPVTVKSTLHRVKLFNHLYADRELPDNILNSANIHPSVIKLGAQYANRIVVGSNARCIAFMNTMKMVIYIFFFCMECTKFLTKSHSFAGNSRI